MAARCGRVRTTSCWRGRTSTSGGWTATAARGSRGLPRSLVAGPIARTQSAGEERPTALVVSLQAGASVLGGDVPSAGADAGPLGRLILTRYCPSWDTAQVLGVVKKYPWVLFPVLIPGFIHGSPSPWRFGVLFPGIFELKTLFSSKGLRETDSGGGSTRQGVLGYGSVGARSRSVGKRNRPGPEGGATMMSTAKMVPRAMDASTAPRSPICSALSPCTRTQTPALKGLTSGLCVIRAAWRSRSAKAVGSRPPL